ncbi:MAG: glycosyltransferase family 1 protein [Bacteroidales bacterium]|nr:glycosyltransferase family 1 protein [Bacteroidales bacterium]
MEQQILIGFDAKRITHNATGLGNYCRTLVNNIIRKNSGKYLLRLYTPDAGNPLLKNRMVLDKHVRFAYPRKNLWKSLWRSALIVNDLTSDGIKLYHGLTGELPIGIKKTGIKTVVTIHDLIFMRHPIYYHWTESLIYKIKFRLTCKEADHFIAISECTKSDIMSLGGIPDSRISVIYQGCDEGFKQQVDEKRKQQVSDSHHLPPKYILTVGTLEERKNAGLIVKALERLPYDINLVMVGRRTPYINKVMREAERHGIGKRILILSDLPFSDLPAIYQMAEVFVYPSRYEGFGIPIIEAIHSGIPVVAAKGSCLEEAGGPDSMYVDPDDADALARCILANLQHTPEREQRIVKSRQYVARFDEQNLADEVLKVYESLLSTVPASKHDKMRLKRQNGFSLKKLFP